MELLLEDLVHANSLAHIQMVAAFMNRVKEWVAAVRKSKTANNELENAKN